MPPIIMREAPECTNTARPAALTTTGNALCKPRKPVRKANEARILDAAERVFAGAGFGGATMAAIAEAAELPKANLHYYFGNKRTLYRAVLARILDDWLEPVQGIVLEADPRTALETYIRDKMRMAFARPQASKVFANELLHGAPEIGDMLATTLRPLVREKVAVIDQWKAQGRIGAVDGTHLFFTIWAATQTYADFGVQIQAVLGMDRLDATQQQRATRHVIDTVLKACGLP
ncbi:MAG: TetR family transcriptional regulator C-terminal domain-containing protein [Pseudomonadota bacterium]